MARRHSLSESGDYYAVLTPRFRRDLLDNSLRGQRAETLKPIRDAVSHHSPARPPHRETDPVAGVEELKKLYGPGDVRILCRAVRNFDGRELLFVFSIDPTHDYGRPQLIEADEKTSQLLSDVERIGDDVLAQHELLDADDLRTLIDEYES